MPESMPGRCAIIGLKSNEFRELGNPGSLTDESTRRAPLCGRVPLYLRRPNGRLAKLTDSDILISPGYQRLTYFPDPIKTASSVEIKSLRHPSVHVSPTFRWRSRLKNVSRLGCKSPSRFQRELDSRSQQTSLMSRPFGCGIRPSSIFGELYELTQSSGSFSVWARSAAKYTFKSSWGYAVGWFAYSTWHTFNVVSTNFVGVTGVLFPWAKCAWLSVHAVHKNKRGPEE